MICRICQSEATKFLDLGNQPIANGFLTPDQFQSEHFYNLSVAFCSNCLMVQLVDQPDPSKMFHNNYAFFSSTSSHMAAHFENWAKDVIEKYKPEFVVEIGSNDGIMLQHFEHGKRYGIDPSYNVVQVARGKGIQTICGFFNEMNAEVIEREYGKKADVILSANVMAHIPDIHSVMRGVKLLLKPDGFLIFEDPYIGDILEKTSYDQIYDEHAFFFSVSSIIHLVSQHGMELIDVERQDTHGGSMRYTVANAGKHVVSKNVEDFIMREYLGGLDDLTVYKDFASEVSESRIKLIDILKKIKSDGGNIVGYAATAKSATVTNYCGIGPDLIDYICDTTPIKQGKFSPGAHIPVKQHQEFRDNPPSHALLFAWNHTKEIMEKEKDFKGKWIVYVPEVKILDSCS